MNTVLTSRNTCCTNKPENNFAVFFKVTSSEVLAREQNGKETADQEL